MCEIALAMSPSRFYSTPIRIYIPIAALALALITTQAFASDLPNPSLTPGAINPYITQQNIHQTVCIKGYTKTIRPPSYYTNKLKKRQIREYGYEDRNPKHYEEDHLVALSIGGAPHDPRNLWPEPRKSEWNAKKKDQLEFVLYKLVCRDKSFTCRGSARDGYRLDRGLETICPC